MTEHTNDQQVARTGRLLLVPNTLDLGTDTEVPLDTVLDLQDTLIEHTRAIAQAYVQQVFLAQIKGLALQAHRGEGGTVRRTLPELGAMEELKALFERLRPLEADGLVERSLGRGQGASQPGLLLHVRGLGELLQLLGDHVQAHIALELHVVARILGQHLRPHGQPLHRIQSHRQGGTQRLRDTKPHVSHHQQHR